jgi:hypothetical protein
MHKCVYEMQVAKYASTHLFWVEGRLQGHADGIAEVSDAKHNQRQPLSFRKVPHRHCCCSDSSTVALYLQITSYRTVRFCSVLRV